jgi:phospholipid/cholesterol/gamma-HCH transport system substrate-binding protein
MDRIDSTLAKLDSTAGNANALIAENRPPINSFANDGLASSARPWPSCAA